MLAFFDGVLLAAIVILACRALTDRNLLRAIVQLIAMGMLVAVAWVRLGALDVALAEAAVGSGLTGALLLGAWARMRRRGHGRAADEKEPRP